MSTWRVAQDNDLGTIGHSIPCRSRRLVDARSGAGAVRPRTGLSPQNSDAELMILALMQPPGFVSEARWLRHAGRGNVPYLPDQTGCTLRLHRLHPALAWVIGGLVSSTAVGADDEWVG